MNFPTKADRLLAVLIFVNQRDDGLD